jgi:HTH-type transcriptional regulator/antitoxin HigA
MLLRTLMEEHGLTRSDLFDIGSQGVVSEILSGKRELNLRRIILLSAHFGVSPAIFMPAPVQSNKRRSRRARKAPAR